MTNNLTNSLSCDVFGHNFTRSNLNDPSEIVCSSCNSKMHIDKHGNFKALPSINKEIHHDLRQLFLLTRLKKRMSLGF